MTPLFRSGAAKRVSTLLFMLGMMACLLFFVPDMHVAAQVRVSATPISGALPQAQQEADTEQEIVFMSPTPSITPTEDPSVTLERNPGVLAWNVYDIPDPDVGYGIVIGSLEEGVRYPVVGRYFEWLQFSYDISPTGFGWIHGTEVILNNNGPIPEIDPFSTSTPTAPGADAELTRVAVTLTPGAFETLDAEARLITLPEMESTGELESAGALPTFTQPAEVAPRDVQDAAQDTSANTFEETLVRAATGQIPPLAPILMLAGAGLLGMIVSLWRR